MKDVMGFSSSLLVRATGTFSGSGQGFERYGQCG